MSRKTEIIYGSVYGLLSIIGEGSKHVYPSGETRRKVLCQCACGSEPKEIILNNILTGTSTSCGCYMLSLRTKHGMGNTRQYKCWADMKNRCDNSNLEVYKDYGARGISYQSSWVSFEGFWEDMGDTYSDNLTLDRIDVNGDYTKENCRWTTRSVQSHNRRKLNSPRKFTGVSRKEGVTNFHAFLTYKGRHIFLGMYPEESDAAKAYDDASSVIFLDRPNQTAQNEDDWIYLKVLTYLNKEGLAREMAERMKGEIVDMVFEVKKESVH